jgi:hypothetical protein
MAIRLKLAASCFVLCFTTNFVLSQSNSKEYEVLANIADSLYRAKDYKNSALKFSEAFRSIGWRGTAIDRYNAACSWALTAVPDSAFYQLDRIVSKLGYANYGHITTDPDLASLHNDERWKPLIEKVRLNKEKDEAKLNRPLAAELDSIYGEDQKYRLQIDSIDKKFGWDSKEMKDHWRMIHHKDSLNLIRVKTILDKYGWLGADVVGWQGNSTLFLVIQHADISTQEKYLPMMRAAVKNKKAQASSLALLEDRVLLRQGKMQVYGSQIARDPETQKHFVSPMVDPDNVDKRRADMGLGSLAEYVSQWNIKWDVKQYKKDLPRLKQLSKVK